MKRRVAALSIVAALSAVFGLSACGGGSDSPSAPKISDAPALVKTDTIPGTGTEVLPNATVTVNYTLYLYDPAAAGSKGTQIEGPAALTQSLVSLIPGWQQGIPGMKAGGRRTLIVPSSLGYGSTGSGKVPANSGLVFDIDLQAVNNVFDVPALVKTDTVVGTGAEPAADALLTVSYTAYQYNPAAPGSKGAVVEGPGVLTRQLSSMLAGLQQGIPGMRIGGQRTLIVPSSLAYGVTGSGKVPGSSALVIDVELPAIADAPELVKTDTVVGTGAQVAAGQTVNATYTLYLYDSTKADFKGARVEGPATADFTLDTAKAIAGWVQGVPGMLVGGKRTLIIPSSLAYGTTGNAAVPPNSGLVFDIQIKAIK